MRLFKRESTFRAGAAVALLLALACIGPQPARAYTVTGYVWQFQPGDPAPQRVAWHPVDSPGNINFLSPITFSVPSAGAPVGAGTEVRAAFTRWNQLAGPANIRYRLVPFNSHIVINFTANPAGVPGEITLGAADSEFRLDSSLVVRTDRFSLDIPPINSVASDPLDEYDVYTTSMHEVGHDLGLHHRRNGCATMTAQNQARGISCSEWAVDTGAAVEGAPAGTEVYNNPRRVLNPDDITGLRTLYSQPSGILELTRSTFNKFAKRFSYEYRAVNSSLAGSDYHLTRLEMPIPGVLAENIAAPTDWAVSADTDDTRVVWEYVGTGSGIPPGGNFLEGFDFDHPLAPQFGSMTTGFSLPALAGIGVGPNGDFDDPAAPSTVDLFHDTIPPIGLAFDPMLVTNTAEGFVPDFFTADIPTLSEWGMLILSGLFLTSLVVVVARRVRTVPAGSGTA